mgnify:CR=1 FL=1
MTSKEYELIKEMLQMQEKLDEAIMKEYGLTKIDEENLRMAILDEVGELTHELKGNWCWWKKTQAPVDMGKVLGELVDVWHFVLSYQNHFNDGEEGLTESEKLITEVRINFSSIKFNGLVNSFGYLINYGRKVADLCAITECLGFTVGQVYQAYCDKNKVNYQRLEEGY